MLRRKIGSLGLFVSVLVMPAAVSAQNTGIAGVVRDPSGAVMPGVTVDASSPALIEKVRSVVRPASSNRYSLGRRSTSATRGAGSETSPSPTTWR
jgi:hypothetical protein